MGELSILIRNSFQEKLLNFRYLCSHAQKWGSEHVYGTYTSVAASINPLVRMKCRSSNEMPKTHKTYFHWS